MRYRITTVFLIVIVIATVFQISLVSATSVVEWKADYNLWSQVEDAEGQKQNTMGQVPQASTATVQPANPNASDDAKKKHSIFLPLLQRTTFHPANPNASDDAKRVLSYIASLPDRPDRRVISGQYVSYKIRDTPAGFYGYVEMLYDLTGKWLGMIGVDYGLGCTPGEISTGNQILIDHWNDGGLVTIVYHVNNPWTGGDSWDLRDRDLVELIDPESDVYDIWMAELDKAAAGLAELRDAGVVVLWRPFHEMTYWDCFWWDAGAHSGNPEPYKNMWKHMFNYFTYEKGLDNLLWVYAPADTDNWSSVDALYPGDGYVDIVGIDSYDDQLTLAGNAYSKLLALGKPFALTETGPYPTRDGSWDNTNVINRIRSNYPRIAFFLHWFSWEGNEVAIIDNQKASELLNDPWVITRDELDWVSQPTPTPTPTSTPTPTPTQTLLPTYTPTATNTPLPTYTPTLTSTSIPSPTNTPTSLPTNTPTFAPTDTPASTNTPLPTDTPTLTPTSTPTPTPTQTLLPTYTPTATNTPLPTYTPRLTSTSIPSPTNTPTSLPTDTPTPTSTPLPTDTPTLTPTTTPMPTPT